jgi:hypothetical protein
MPPEKQQTPEDWKQLLSFGGLAGAVLAILLLGALLSTDSPRTTIQAGLGPPAPGADLTTPTAPPPETSRTTPPADRAPADPPADHLARRALADLERMTGAQGWTAQLAVLCDAEHVGALTERFGDDDAYYLLPVLHGDTACFRICWNRYPTREQAASAADLPRAMRAIESRPLPKNIAEVVE